MPDTSLLLLLDEVRGKTLRILKTIPAGQERWAPAGLQNTILWHAGHAYVTVESLAMRALGRPPEFPPGWPELFAMNSRPAEVPADRWPTLADVIGQLEAQHRRLKGIIAGLSPDQLDAPSAVNPDRTARYGILHGLHDEACHSGEIHLLRKMQGAAQAPGNA
jgi:hypothetical protein